MIPHCGLEAVNNPIVGLLRVSGADFSLVYMCVCDSQLCACLRVTKLPSRSCLSVERK
jgi:hypothetical protein